MDRSIIQRTVGGASRSQTERRAAIALSRLLSGAHPRVSMRAAHPGGRTGRSGAPACGRTLPVAAGRYVAAQLGRQL